MKPLLYDVYCCAGGATRGYQNAGFRVIGIDNKPQPHYIGDGFILMDALEFLDRYIAGEFERADAFHASPPCQGYCVHAGDKKRDATPKLIPETKLRLIATQKPFIIENVDSAMREGAMPEGIMLCGRMFDLNIIRHRWFICNPMILSPNHPRHRGFLRKYAESNGIDYRDMAVCGKGRRAGFTRLAQSLMGIDWFMFQSEITEAIPPSYTQFLGKYLMQAVMNGR